MNWDYNNLINLSTSRCRLRPIRLSDAPALLRLYSNPAVIRYTEHHIPMQSIEEAEYSINFYRNGYAEGWMYRWGVTLAHDASDTLIGTVGLHRINHTHRRCSIGYEIDEPYWNRGYSTEIVQRLTTYGLNLLDMNRIEAELISQNIGSAKVLLKNGYRYEATRRQRLKKRLRLYDIDIYSLLRSDWYEAQN